MTLKYIQKLHILCCVSLRNARRMSNTPYISSLMRRVYGAFECTLGATILFVAVYAFTLPASVIAQESLVLSVTPPFSQIILVPGDTIRSYVKVVNANPFPLAVYANPVNFSSTDEQGTPKFIPLLNDPVDATTFAGWIAVTKDAITIPPESSVNVDYTISVPEAAPPGGHFAAILIGTRPPEGDDAGVVKTSQVVSSLFMARVAGDVVEEGQIREFSVARTFVPTPRAEFMMRFENTGSVYLQPQGDITIYNMWGKERGFIPVNHKTNFGNVLPKSIRKFSFTWEGTPSITDIGRYKAIATVSYGIDSKRSVDRTVYFWVIPWKATLITFAFIALLVLFVVFAIRLYVRRVLDMAGIDRTPVQSRAEKVVPRAKVREVPAVAAAPRRVTRTQMVAPLRAGVLDLRKAVSNDGMVVASRSVRLGGFAREYRSALFAVTIGLIGLALIVWYIIDAREESRPYEVIMKQGGADVRLTSNQVEERRANELVIDPIEPTTTNRPRVSIVNASGVMGAGSAVVEKLEKSGFSIGDISTDADTRATSVIVYNASEIEHAKRMSELWDGIPLSGRAPGEEAEPALLLIVGADRAE